jgi:NADH:ubiquinone oxidoreductase subunit E
MSKFHAPEKAIYVCVGSKCGKKGGKAICKEFKDIIKTNGLKDDIEIVKTECTDRCKFAPVLSIQPANVWVKEYSERDAFKFLKIAYNEE